jgi:CheY-like chemotaxis protein
MACPPQSSYNWIERGVPATVLCAVLFTLLLNEAHVAMNPTNPAEAASLPSKSVVTNADRRRRKRAKITAQVHVRGGIGTINTFEDLCTSIDVSRDGLLFTTIRKDYWVGQVLDVTFPYSSAATAINTSQRAKIVRMFETKDGRPAVAVHFEAAANRDTKSPAGSRAAAQTFAPQTMVLAVESDERLAENMRSLLQQDGYHVIIVKNAKQALDVLKTTVPAVILAEFEGEELGGQDLCLIVKKDERLKHIPVILITQAAQPADYSTSHQYGAVVCMAKPFKPERLQHVVRLVAPPPSQKSAYGAKLGFGLERTL